MVSIADDIGQEERDAMKWDSLAQFEQFNKIVVKKGGDPIAPEANIHQVRLAEVAKVAHEMGVPCRVIGLKPRQKGSSTKSVHIGHCRLKAGKARGLIAGGAHFQTENMFEILGTYATEDSLDPGYCTVQDKLARYKNGSRMQRITLASKAPGRSGTYQYLLITEAAYLAKEGVANADVVLDGLLKCVAMEPDTIIIVESTANGASGYFYDMWEKAITLEEFKAGKVGYVRVFSAWFEFDDSRMEPSKVGIYSEADYTAQEVEYILDLRSRLGVELDMDQVAWMRYAREDECKGDWDKFKQDYPSDPETAFLTSGRCAFSQEALQYQQQVAERTERTFGTIVYNERADLMTFVPCEERTAMVVRMEKPIPGCRYLLCADTMTGADQTGGDDPDSHGVFVLRAGYVDRRGVWHEPAVVARNMMVPGSKPGSLCCWWNIDVLEVEIWKLARMYQAIIVPEMNMDRGLVELLKLRPDVQIWMRRIFNKREQQETDAYGWETTVKTRPMILDALIAAVRKTGKGEIGTGIEIRCPWAVKQAKNFGTKPNGRMEALTGHDDDILSLAIGNYLLETAATPYIERIREEWVPPDLREQRRGRRGRGDSTYS